MPTVIPVGGKQELVLETLDGGLNTHDAPSKISVYDSPDCLNVSFEKHGSVATRYGCSYFNTVPVGSGPIDGAWSYNGTMVVACNGGLYRASGTTMVPVSGSTGQFASGVNVAGEIYQKVLFLSDGTNGPWRYEGGDGLYNMGIFIPSAPTSASNVPTATGGGPEGGTYYYAVAFYNSHVVVGEPGSMSAGLTIGSTSVVNVTGIPVGTQTQGVAQRYIYRASSPAGVFANIGVLPNNTATVFTDTVGATTWAVGSIANLDATSPTPFTTIKLHKERLFFDDSSDRSLLRYTDYQNPYVSEALNVVPINRGDLSNITAIAVQNDMPTVFKQNSVWLVNMYAASDDTTWQYQAVPGTVGIVGPNAFTEIPGGLVFVGRRNNFITGLHLLAGLNISETAHNAREISDLISLRIEPNVLSFNKSLWSQIALTNWQNRLYMAGAESADTENDHIYTLELHRLSDEGEPGSWSRWDGRSAKVRRFLAHSDGNLYGGSSLSDGYMLRLEIPSQYNDCGTAINSYHWTKPLGGSPPDVEDIGPSFESWIKDFRWFNVWFSRLGAWFMKISYRLDSDQSDGTSQMVDVTPPGAIWGSFVWGDGSVWSGPVGDDEKRLSLGASLGRRIQFKFSNNNTVDTGFRVNSIKLLMNLRRQTQ